MTLFSIILTIAGLCLFETICSVNNAIINAQVLSTMSMRARRWFLMWGILIAVFIVRGTVPWLIVWAATPELGPIGSFTATFHSDPHTREVVERAAPVLLMAGGSFLIFLFFHWLFIEPKDFGLRGEDFFLKHGAWFYAVASVILTALVWYALKISAMIAFGAVVGSTVFFITHGFKQNAETHEKQMLSSRIGMSDLSKLFYLEVIDATFSIDGVLGAFAFTLAVPLILAGNGLGAVVVRQLTVGNIQRIKSYKYLNNGAMYSVLVLGAIMIGEAFGLHLPSWVSPVATFAVVAYFLLLSIVEKNRHAGAGSKNV
jgi:hypothetical protein